MKPKEIKKNQGAIILGNFSVVSTGVNFKRLHFMVYLSSLKSYFKIIQSIGRGMRLHYSKSIVQVYDLVDILTTTNKGERPNYTLKHFYERLEYYLEDKFNVDEVEIKLQGDVKKHTMDNAFSDF